MPKGDVNGGQDDKWMEIFIRLICMHCPVWLHVSWDIRVGFPHGEILVKFYATKKVVLYLRALKEVVKSIELVFNHWSLDALDPSLSPAIWWFLKFNLPGVGPKKYISFKWSGWTPSTRGNEREWSEVGSQIVRKIDLRLWANGFGKNSDILTNQKPPSFAKFYTQDQIRPDRVKGKYISEKRGFIIPALKRHYKSLKLLKRKNQRMKGGIQQTWASGGGISWKKSLPMNAK
jgi:hypothetical protein